MSKLTPGYRFSTLSGWTLEGSVGANEIHLSLAHDSGTLVMEVDTDLDEDHVVAARYTSESLEQDQPYDENKASSETLQWGDFSINVVVDADLHCTVYVIDAFGSSLDRDGGDSNPLVVSRQEISKAA